ncbi:MAG: NIPSNAP family protein [Rubritepida sp.]|nr:NIPSNAP family protein [Rubritepida sp.]
MIIDLRIYTCKPNKMAAFVKLYEEKAWPLQLQYLENCLGWHTTVEGQLNRVVHMWGYSDQGDRERRRAAMAADPAWAAYLQAAADSDLLLDMENRILKRTSFFDNYLAGKA